MEEPIQNTTNIKRTKLVGKKKLFYEILCVTLGNVSEAEKRTNICRSTHYDWLKHDPNYKLWIDDLNDNNLDFAESCLKKLMKEGNVTAIIFFLKTKGKIRGYIERTELEFTKEFPEVKINIIYPEKKEAEADGAIGDNRVPEEK